MSENETLRILALETTVGSGSVALADGRKLLRSKELGHEQRTAQSLLPGVKELLAEAGWHPREVQLVGVSIGPGSFTGLRLGITAAKVFAYAAGTEVLGIDTLETIAARAPQEVDELAVAVDALRGEVVGARFVRRPDGWLRPAEAARLISIEQWLASLKPGIWVSGPALGKLAPRLPEHVRLVPNELWKPTAEAVARLAARDYQAGRRDDLWTLAPCYWRPSAAEEKRPRDPPDEPRAGPD